MEERNRKIKLIHFIISLAITAVLYVLLFLDYIVIPRKLIYILYIVIFIINIYLFSRFSDSCTNQLKNVESIPYDMKSYDDIPEYKGLKSFFVSSPDILILLSLPLLFWFILIPEGDSIKNILSNSFVYIIFYLCVLFKYLIKFIKLKEEGIYFYNILQRKKLFFPWNEIHRIGVSKAPSGVGRAGYIFISKIDTLEIPDPPKYSESHIRIMIVFRPTVAHCIMKYYDGPIDYLGNNKKWHKYIRKQRKKSMNH